MLVYNATKRIGKELPMRFSIDRLLKLEKQIWGGCLCNAHILLQSYNIIHDIPIVILICYGILCLIAPSSRWLKTLRCAKSLNFGTPQCF